MKKAIVSVLLAFVMVFLGQAEVREALIRRAEGVWQAVRGVSTPDEALEREELVLLGPQPATDVLPVTLYYRYGQTDVLGLARVELDIRRDETIARSIVDQLVAGPDSAHTRLTGVFPTGTQVLSVTTDGPTAIVTLSEEFLGAPDGAPAGWEDLTVWQEEATLRRWLAAQSIVASLTEGGRYQRVLLCVAKSDNDAPQRIPLVWFDLTQSDPNVVLGLCTRDEQALLTPQRAGRMIFEAWQQQDWETVYALLAPGEGEALLTYSAFAAKMYETDVSLLTYEVSGGAVDATGEAATLLFSATIRSRTGGDAQIEHESVPLVRIADNWAMPLDALLGLMIRE